MSFQFLLLFACLFVFAVGCAPNWKDASGSAVSATGIYARNEKESDFHVEIVAIGSGLEVGDDLENPDDFDFIPDTALSLVCLGQNHPA